MHLCGVLKEVQPVYTQQHDKQGVWPIVNLQQMWQYHYVPSFL